MDSIYLDHAATSPMHPEVIKAMVSAMDTTFGNPSSIHHFGRKARSLLDEARRFAAETIHADEKEIFFTSGGTEADNLAVIGVALANQAKGKHIITTTIEHHATLHAVEFLEKKDFDITYLPVTKEGFISLADFDAALREDTILVSVMMVNNEVGSIQPIEAIGKRLINHQAHFHTDAVQAYSLLDIDVKKMGIDLLTVSAHKINGPKGVGFLYADRDVHLHALQYGGSQERTKRPGTENIAAIVGFHQAMQIAFGELQARLDCYTNYRAMFLEHLTNAGITFSVNGELTNTVPTIVNISFPGANVESLLMNLDLAGIAASSGSACTAGSLEPSHVLSAMFGSDDERTMNSIRFSFGLANDIKQIETAAAIVAKIINRLVK